MRIAYVCADPGVPVFGNKGCSIHVREVISALRRTGATVELFATRFDGEKPSDWHDVVVHALPPIGKGDATQRESAAILANQQLEQMLADRSPFDLIYERYSLWSIAAVEFAVQVSIPCVLEVNAPLIDEQSAHRKLVHRDIALANAQSNFARATRVLSVSAEVGTYVQAVAANAHLVVVPNGVDHHRFRPEVESALPHLAGQFVIGFSGSMKPWHGLPNLIAAFESIKEQLPHAHLLLVGDGGELPAVRDALQQRGLLSAATLTGAVPSAQMPGLIAAMDVAVAPYPASTDFYFSPLKIVEYMAAGRAIVASRIGQICELLEHDRTALLCEAGDSDSLANAILRMTNDALRIHLGSAARTRAVERHTWDQVAAKIIRFANERALVEASA